MWCGARIATLARRRQVWRWPKWPLQSAVLRAFFRYLCCEQWYNPEGITAVPPADYALRFEEFLTVHMLGMPFTAASGKTWQPFW